MVTCPIDGNTLRPIPDVKGGSFAREDSAIGWAV